MESAVLNAENAAPNQKGIQVTERALKRIRVAMAKEGVSPEQGGLRLGIQGGGCSGFPITFGSTRSRENAIACTTLKMSASSWIPSRLSTSTA